MDAEPVNQVVELRLTYRYIKDHPWTVQAINGFLSAYFMEKPGIFRAATLRRSRIGHARVALRGSVQHENHRALATPTGRHSSLAATFSRPQSPRPERNTSSTVPSERLLRRTEPHDYTRSYMNKGGSACG
jgi:hypothetical protein